MFAALGGVLAVSLLCFYVLRTNATVAALLLLLVVLLTGIYASLAEAILISLWATLLLDYFFIPPIKAIAIGDPQGWVALLVFLAVSLIATNLSTRLRRQRDELRYRHQETEKLHALNRAMLFSSGEDARRLITNKCVELFDFEEAVLFESASGQFHRTQADSAITNDQLARVATYGSIQENDKTRITILPVSLGNKTFGSLGFRGPALPEATLQALGNTVAIGLAQAQALEAGSRAEAVRKSEELKSVMLDALAHDLKTPLTVIEAATDMLVDWSRLSDEQRQDLLRVVHQEGQGLKRKVVEAIHLARIDAKRLQLQIEPLSPRELIDRAVSTLGDRAGSHVITVDCASALPAVQVDRELLVEALKQLVDNAVKYSPAGSPINITASATNGLVSIAVRDHGPGLTELEQSRIFNKFYRGRYDRSAIQGTGMGLAIAKEIIEAHGGSIMVESQVGQGCLFTLIMHAAEEPVTAGTVSSPTAASSSQA
jgi:two-component system, OmpR family, sensor histidine kinase KdpD